MRHLSPASGGTHLKLILIALLPLALATGAAAQQPAPLLFRDSLAASSDTVALRALLAQQSQDNGDAEALLRRGFVLLRLSELKADEDEAKRAREVFEKAVPLLAGDPRGEYAVGLAYRQQLKARGPSGGGITVLESAAEILKRDPQSRAYAALRKSLAIDPGFAPAALELAAMSIETRNAEWLRLARVSLEPLAARGEPAAAVALTRVNALLGDAAGAAAAAAIAEKTGGASAVEAGYGHAVALLRSPQTAEQGATIYFANLAKDEGKHTDLFFRDIYLVTTEAERAAWENLSGPDRVGFIRTFWESRAALSGVSVADRLSEHYQRLAAAYERYHRSGKRGAPPNNALIANTFEKRSIELDDRGIMLLRHGEPDEIVRVPSADLRPFETWVYYGNSENDNRLHHFVQLSAGTDYFLVSDPFAAVDASTANPPIDAVQGMLRAIGRFDQRYNLMAAKLDAVRGSMWAVQAVAAITGNPNAGSGLADGARSTMQSLGEQRQRVSEEHLLAGRRAFETDSHDPGFEADLPFYYDLYTFKDESGATDMTAAIAVPGTELVPSGVPGNYVYSLNVSVIVADSAFKRVSRKDTTYSFRSRRELTDGEYMRVTADLLVPANPKAIHRVIVRDGNHVESGQLYGGDLRVPSYQDEKLSVSDVILAEPASGAWRRGSVDLAFVPPRQFEEGAAARLFYEVYNMPNGANYRTEISVKPMDKGVGFKRLFRKRTPISLEFEGVAAPRSGIMQELRQISAELKPGRYRVAVTVTNLQTQENASSETEFVVIKRKR